MREVLINKTKTKNKNKNKFQENDNNYLKPDTRGAEVPIRKTLDIKRLDNETDTAFCNRMDREVENVIHRSQYENQFEVKLETKDDKVIVKKDKKMREGKRRSLN